ncbi:hypothetical protein CEQ90_15585 [Lewinellaceae bacterium SD302]|nr:hypothetical protein CEQ90_15585 [Lewinellaceae bacterium SD302]
MRQLLFILTVTALLVGCVPKNQYDAAQAELNYYRNEATRTDSINSRAEINEYNSGGAADLEAQRLIRENESLRATNISLNESFQDLSARFDEQVRKNIELTQATGSQVTDLQQSLADRKAEVSQQEQLLREKEIELYEREQQLATVAPNQFDPVAGQPAAYGNTVNTPQSLNLNQQTAMRQNQLQSELRQTLGNYAYTDVRYGNKGSNDVTLTLSQAILFSNGYQLSADGIALVQRIATVLQRYPNAEVRVIGHSDPTADPVIDLENSTDRAIAITQQLVGRGIPPQNVLAAGQGAYSLLTNDNSSTGRAENRRTEIMIVLP